MSYSPYDNALAERPKALPIPRGYPADCKQIILDEIASGKNLEEICGENKKVPPIKTVRYWLANDEKFIEDFIKTQKVAALEQVQRVVEISDGDDGEEVQRDRLRVKTRMDLAAKLLPKVYGDRVKHEHELQAGDSLSGLLNSLVSESGLTLPTEKELMDINNYEETNELRQGVESGAVEQVVETEQHLQDNKQERTGNNFPAELGAETTVQEHGAKEYNPESETVGDDDDDTNLPSGSMSFQQEYRRRSGGSYFR